jgi:hypothetical protein
MSITALYVYSPTTFKTHAKIDSMDGTRIIADKVTHHITLDPGVYRLKAGAKIEGVTGSIQSGYDVVDLAGKTGWPDPPQGAFQVLKKSNAELQAFLMDAGGTTDLD